MRASRRSLLGAVLVLGALCGAWGVPARAEVPAPLPPATLVPSSPEDAPGAPEGPGEDEGPPGDAPETLLIEAIDLIGNEKTLDSVILRRLDVREGELLDERRLEVARLRLLNTGFFSAVEFSLRRGSRRGQVLLVIEVVERNTILVEEVFFGSSSASPFFGGLDVAESNFFGRGISVAGGFIAGEDRRALELRTFVPDLSDTPLQLSFSAILLDGAESIAPAQPELGALRYQRRGGTLGVGFSAGAAQRVSLIYRLESVFAERLPNLDPSVLRRAPSLLLDESVLSSLTASYELDTRDDPFLPSQGSRVALAVELGTSLLGSSYEFSKYTVELQQAFAPVRDHRLILRLFGGVVQGATPFFNQFFIGDWSYFTAGRRILPRQLQLNFSASNDYDDVFASLGAEYDVPLFEGGAFLYRLCLYGGLDVSGSASLGELQEDEGGRGFGGRFPLSFDVGLKLDTALGNFTLSLAYLGNMAI